MSRINSNIASLTAQRVLGANNQGLNKSLERLSTGLRINRGKDDPAGLIASENLRGEISSLNAAISNSERADQVVNIAEGGLQEVSNLLTELQGLLTTSANSAGLSDAEKKANQLQIDSILQTVDRIAASTTFQGTRLLNGNFDYTVSGVSAGVTDFQINGSKFDGGSLAVDAIVTQSAQQGALYLSLGGTSLNLNGGGAVNSAFTIEVSGALGSRELSFGSGQTVDQIAAAINTFTDVTGVTATASGTGISLRSSEYGSNAFAGVKVVNDGGVGTANSVGVYGFDSGSSLTVAASTLNTFTSTTLSNGTRDAGQDLAGTINGIVATGDGNTLSIHTDFLDVLVTLSTESGVAGNALSIGNVNAFSITGGGADFQLAGNVDIAGKVSIGIGDVSTRKLGRSDIGFLNELSSAGDFNVIDGEDLATAQKIVAEAIEQVSSTRGRLGAFQKNVIGATVRSLGVAVENSTAAESVIRDADFARETAGLTRNQILVQASTNVLSLANSQPQSALALLG